MDGAGGGYDRCRYAELPGEVDINYKHMHMVQKQTESGNWN